MDLTEPTHALQTVLKNKRLPQGEASGLGSYPRGGSAKINKISTMQNSSSQNRVIAYIDGFNLFYGLKRQATYLSALENSGIKIIKGHFQTSSAMCSACSHQWNETKEKMTDVNIATEMITDAFQNQFDVAILISGDSDLVPPIRAIRCFFTTKKVLAVFPPDRSSKALKETAHASLSLGRKKIQDAQFPDRIILPSKHVISAPEGWT